MQAIKTSPQTKTLSFYKENGLWYADLPQFLELGLGTKANLLMVDGADTFLDLLSNKGTRATVKFGKEPFSNHNIHLKKIKIGLNQDLLDRIGHPHVNYGAYYNVLKYQKQSFHHTLWLCPVAEFVFNGEYPENIYLKKI